MISYDENIAHESIWNDPNLGSVPVDVKCAWPDIAPPPEIADCTIFYIDDATGETVGQCEDISAARRFIEAHAGQGFTVRPYVWNEEKLRALQAKIRADRRYASGFGG